MIQTSNIVIELTVNNHPGVMSHITGLFARRAFNLEGILCGRIGDGRTSKIYLLVTRDDRLDQIIKQVRKLYDVLDIKLHEDFNIELFERVHEVILKEPIQK
ncbi:MAG: ACT domain-containing protein [Pseudomonadota bacterium]